MSRTEDHVAAFNLAVTSGAWEAFADRFAPDATMRFVGVPAGPFEGRTAIAAAYRENPPGETMTLIEDGDERARFRWSGGGTGTMELRWAPDGAVQTLTVSFD
ncbi:nuclear transport factor 2 family protein [Kribbella sindirgiensis]|uniref:Nuclear transport factor 2 family protein n=1 Tax=Kribbella sindirgiensis TaxID=1124744 RepID=A0A4R0I6I0_9ACTN|nr:nuclear transport factor 2 family protein [Kribbella sindirgiensis]TCC28491.1 nuclear transport factor 2 family protein [Kribbella sindirgiensis]